MAYSISSSIVKKILLGTALVALQSCSDQPKETVHLSQTDLQNKSLEQIVKEYQGKDPKKAQIAQGINNMLEGQYAEAAEKFNTILNSDPSNSTVHMLNGINYQLQGKDGDGGERAIAEAAFVQANKFNPSSVLANVQLGRAKKASKNYAEAQEAFASALLINPNDPAALYELATTSYLMGDLKTAKPIIEQYLKIQPNRSEGWQAAAIIRAAAGDAKGAQKALNHLIAAKGKTYTIEQTQNRVLDWKKLYDQGLITLAQANSPLGEEANVTIAEEAKVDTPADGASDAPAADPAAAAAAPGAKPVMVVLDGLVLRFTHDADTSKGQNILDKFSVLIAPGTHLKARGKGTNGAGGSGPNFSVPIGASGTLKADGSAATNLFPDAKIEGGGANPFSISRIFAQGIGFSTIQYGLNIANVKRETVQIVNRPSITTILGQKGEFFSGSEYVLGLTGQFGGSITKTPVGIELVVTPTAYDEATDTVTLEIKMYGSFPGLGGFGKGNSEEYNQIFVSKVFTTVNMKMGETLMLAGIQNRLDQQTKEGFPILQDIPGLQYLFSNMQTSSERSQVTFMITPRLAADAKKLTQMQFVNEKPHERHVLTALELRNKDWFSTPFPSWVVHFRMMESLYREFRTGDVPDIHWYAPENLGTSLNELKSFFHY